MSIEFGISNPAGLPGNCFVQHEIPKKKLIAGDISDKRPVYVDERTTIYVNSDATDEQCEERKQAYLTNINRVK